MDMETRMQLHTLIYKIVSLRIVCGRHEDSGTVRGKLEAETRTRIRKLKDLERTTELEAAQRLYDCYEEKAQSLAGIEPLPKRPEPVRITLAI